MQAVNDKAKCQGHDNTGNNVCYRRETCGRYLRPSGDYQWWGDFWMAGKDCINHESIVDIEEPVRLSFD